MNKIYTQKAFKICIFFLLIVFVSCSNLTMPKKITIQADPVIQASLGKIETSLTDYFSVEKIKELMGENEDFLIYDYKHNAIDDTLRFLAQIDYSMEIEGLDVEGNLKELESLEPISFGYEEDGVTPSVLFSIPEINQTIDIDPISLELKDNITDSIKDFSSISFQGVQPGMIQNLENQNIPYPIELCDDEFDTVTFGNGTSLEIGFEQITSSSITTAKINKISIYKAQDIIGMSVKDFIDGGNSLDKLSLTSANLNNPIATTTIQTNLIAGTNLSSSLDLSNKTLPKDICIVLNVSFEGGNENEAVTINTTNSQFSNVSFKKITGFNTINPISVDFPQIDSINLVDSVEGLKGATIEEGEISFSFDNLPAGITPTTKLNFVQADTVYNSVTYQGLNISDKKVENNKISLAGKSLNTKPINISGNLQIEAVDADIDLTQELKVSTGVKIEKFASISMEDSIIPQDVLRQTYSYSLASIAEYVNKIKFNEVGLALKLCNGLPFDATMNVTSNFLGLNNKSETFSRNQTELPTEATKIVAGTPQNKLEKDVSNTTEFDLEINMEMPSSNGVITIPNVETGTDYKFYGQAELIIDWYSVNFILPDDYSGFKGSFPGEDEEPIDLSSLTNILGEDITLSGIKPYLYISSPLLIEGGALEGAELQTVLKTSYTKDENTIQKYLVGSETTSEVLEVVDYPKLTPDENLLVVGALPTPSLEIEGLTDALLSGGKDLKIEYDVKLSGSTGGVDLSSGIEIEKTSMDDLSQSSEIKIGILIDLPIIFTVKQNEKGYASFDIMSLINKSEETAEETDSPDPNENTENPEEEKESDLFGREEGSEIEGLSTVFDFVDNASIKLKYKNNTGIVLNLVMEDTNNENQKFSRIVNLDKGESEIELNFTKEDAEYIQKTVPFYPDILEIQIPGDKTKDVDYEINRNAALNVVLQGSIKTNIDYSIDFEETESETEGEN